MGGLKTRATNLVYVNIKEGKLFATINNEKQSFDELGGYLTDIKIEDDEYEGKKFKKLILTIHYDGVDYLLQMRFDSAYARGFWHSIPNANLEREISISTKYEVKNGKKNYSLFINQNGWLKWKWTNDNPGELPPLEEIEVKGEKVLDNTKQLKFVTHYLLEVVKPQLPHAAIAGEVIMETNPADAMINGLKSHIQNPVDASDISGPVDDLPF